MDLCFIITNFFFFNFTLGFSRCKLLFYCSRSWRSWKVKWLHWSYEFKLLRKLQPNQLGIPGRKLLPSDDDGKYMPLVIMVDKTFTLSEYVVGLYPNKNISIQQQTCNYRITRADWVVECVLGVLANKRSIFHRPLNKIHQFCESIIKAGYILRTFIHRKYRFLLDDTL